MAGKRREIRKYGLYGEGKGLSGPEFVHIEQISTRSRLHDWSIAPHIHPNMFQVLRLERGRGVLAIDGSERELPARTLVIVPCGSAHAFRFEPETEGWVLSIADSLIDDPRLDGLGVAPIARGAVTLLPLGGLPEQDRLFAALLAEIASRHGAATELLSSGTMARIGLLLSLAQELSEAAAPPAGGLLDRRIALVRRFNALAAENLRSQRSIAQYATELGTTPSTLTRACREVAGMAPGQLVIEQRLREAKRALAYTDAEIGLISDDLGFTDPAYFARVFRRHTGLTASAYRRERRWR